MIKVHNISWALKDHTCYWTPRIFSPPRLLLSKQLNKKTKKKKLTIS